MLWFAILFLLTTVAARPQYRHHDSVEEILQTLDFFQRPLRAEEEPPVHEKPRPLRFG